MTKKFEPDKKKMLDGQGRPLTQSLFLELGYNTEFAVYTLKEFDHEYKGTHYPSLKRLFLEEEDPTEYAFSTKYLLNWNHWKRMNENKALSSYFQDWREELEIKLRSQAVRDIIVQCSENSQGSFQAAKWLADRGWDKRAAGRPSKDEKEKFKKIDQRVEEEFGADVARMSDYKVK